MANVLGEKKILLLTNNGAVATGNSVAQAIGFIFRSEQR